MSETFINSVSGKTVVDSEGVNVGTLHNITTNFTTGELNYLLVSPDGALSERQRNKSKYRTTEDGVNTFYQIETSRVQSVSDHIVVR